MEDIFSNFGDLFDNFFGFGGSTRRRRSGPIQGDDLQTQIRISFKDAVFGCKRQIDVGRDITCPTCNGSRSEPGHSPQRCTTCDGKGQVLRASGFFSIQTNCPNCHGSGEMISNPCSECKGRGRATEKRKVDVDIPAGVDNGMQVRLSGEGEGGFRGGPPGDLFIHLSVKDDKRFRREGEEIHSIAEVSMTQAALGAEIEIETIDGKEKISIPRGAQGGDVVTLKEKGVPRLRREGRGNHYLELAVVVPRRMSTRQEELLREFAKESGENVAGPKKGLFKRLKKKK